jgi:hypothetical protein
MIEKKKVSRDYFWFSVFFFVWETYCETETSSNERTEVVKSTVLEVNEHGGKNETVETRFLQRFEHVVPVNLLGLNNSVIGHTSFDNFFFLRCEFKDLGLGFINHEEEDSDTKDSGDGSENNHDPKLFITLYNHFYE